MRITYAYHRELIIGILKYELYCEEVLPENLINTVPEPLSKISENTIK